jgi:hypothetical protein
MSNYYEDLGLSPQVSVEEIRSAIDNRYNQWRQHATHPDQIVVDEANRNLRLLEKMRETLIDPHKRAIYDAGIGLSATGGLADPSAILMPKINLPSPAKPKPVPQPAAPEALWACPKCKTINPEWTQFCMKCQTELVRLCPECGQMKSLVKTRVCGSCGFSYGAGVQRVNLQMQAESLGKALAASDAELEVLDKQQKDEEEKLIAVVLAFSLLIVVFFALAVSALFDRELGWALSLLLLVAVLVVSMVFGVGVLNRRGNGVKAKIANIHREKERLEQRQRETAEAYQELGARKRV